MMARSMRGVYRGGTDRRAGRPGATGHTRAFCSERVQRAGGLSSFCARDRLPHMLNVTDLGEGTPVVWIHGFPLASSIYEHQLAIRGVRHVMPDLPGFGQSRPDGGTLTIDDYARMIVDVVDHRGIDRA